MNATSRGALFVLTASLLTFPLRAQLDTTHAQASRTVPLLTGDRWVTELGAAVTVLDVDSLLRDAPARTLTELLTGRVPGVGVLASSGEIAAGARLVMRGATSPGASPTAPLIYVDGARVDDQMASLTVSVGGQTTSRLDDLNVQDLATIVILPGPAASALYGSDAANGVLLISTKRGQPGRPRLRGFTSQGIAAETGGFPDNFSAVDPSGAVCAPAAVASGACRLLRSNVLASPGSSPFRDGYLRQYGLNVTGGSAAARYYIAGQWDGFGGVYGVPVWERAQLAAAGGLRSDVLNPNDFRRANLHGSGQLFAGSRADLTAAGSYGAGDLRLPLNDNSVAGLLSNGLLGHADTAITHGWDLFLPGEIFQVSTAQHLERFTGSLWGNWRPLPFLTAHVMVGIDRVVQRDEALQRAGEGPDLSIGRAGYVAHDRLNGVYRTVDVTAAAAFRLSAGVTARTTGGFQDVKHELELLDSLGSFLPPGGTTPAQAANLSLRWASQTVRTTALFVEQQLVWRERLFLTGALRRESGPDVPVTLYPQLGFSWLVPGATQIVQSLRLRAAYGVTRRGVAGGGLKQERTRGLEGGFDARLAASRLSLGATVYDQRTTDVVALVNPPPSFGPPGLANVGEIGNKGIELTLVAALLRSPGATWDVSLSAWGNRNRVLQMTTPPMNVGALGVRQVMAPGFPLGSYFGVPILGYADVNGDGLIAPGEVHLGGSSGFLGTPLPTEGGMVSSAVSLGRRLRFSTLLEYRSGNSQMNLSEEARCLQHTCRAANDPAAPLAEQAAWAAYPGTWAGWLESARFLKLRAVAVTVTLPSEVAGRIGARDMTLTLSGRNLATWTSYSGMDPEVNALGTQAIATMDLFTQPQARFWTARVDLSY